MMKYDLSMKNGGKVKFRKLFAEVYIMLHYKFFYLKAKEVKFCIV